MKLLNICKKNLKTKRLSKGKEMKNKRIAVLYGGLSSEREVSLKSGKAVYNALISNGYKNVVLIDVDFDIAKRLIDEKVDVCFNALHGKFGEDGCIQGLLKMMNIPFTGSDVTSSSICFDKVLSKYIFQAEDIKTPPFVVYEEISKVLQIPFEKCVVKPAREGSTIGVSIVDNEKDFCKAIETAKKYDLKILIEKFISGKELTVSVLGNQVLPAIWVRPKKGFYDYESKYTKGMTEYLFETGLDSSEEKRLYEISTKTVRVLGCTSAARVDIIYDGADFFVLEVNTCPGLTETSLLPNAARKAGMSFIQLIERMLELAYEDN
jgi:D-alanine-D-alanine ligase